METPFKRCFVQSRPPVCPAKSLSQARECDMALGPAHTLKYGVRSEVEAERITRRTKTTTTNNLCAPRELHADRCAFSDSAQVPLTASFHAKRSGRPSIKLEKLNFYGRICLAGWRAVLYDHQGRPPTPADADTAYSCADHLVPHHPWGHADEAE